jgi:hypothetical protein
MVMRGIVTWIKGSLFEGMNGRTGCSSRCRRVGILRTRCQWHWRRHHWRSFIVVTGSWSSHIISFVIEVGSQTTGRWYSWYSIVEGVGADRYMGCCFRCSSASESYKIGGSVPGVESEYDLGGENGIAFRFEYTRLSDTVEVSIGGYGLSAVGGSAVREADARSP